MSRMVIVSDLLQPHYEYEIVESIGDNFDVGFLPELSPQEMLELGVFGGNYFEGETDEFPHEWFTQGRISDTHDPQQNFFQIDASQSRQEWQRKGWMHENDPRGWFQWYCRYYMGRRTSGEDQRQIKRWKQMTRHVGQIKAHCAPGDIVCRRRQRQALLHWAYDSRKI